MNWMMTGFMLGFALLFKGQGSSDQVMFFIPAIDAPTGAEDPGNWALIAAHFETGRHITI